MKRAGFTFNTHKADIQKIKNDNTSLNLVNKHRLKAEKLREMAESVLDSDLHKNELSQLLASLKLSREEVIRAYINYDLDIFAYSNEIYEPLIMRMVLHIHNLLKGSWHIERQKVIDELVILSKAESIMDLGFGLPTLYIKNALKKGSVKSILLNDQAISAFNFAEALLDIWSNSWRKMISFFDIDMVILSRYPKPKDLYIFQDSIEHVKDPTTCLKKYVQHSSQHSKFLLSLPIGPITPIHYIAWDTTEEVKEWLKECGLEAVAHKEVHVNPKVDLFAEQLNFNYYNFIVLCKKIS